MATLRFHQTLYARAALDEAAEVFAEVARVELVEDGDYVRVELTPTEADPEDEIRGEFQNYALALTIDGARGAS